MTTDSFEKNIEALQKDVADCLRKVLAILKKAKSLLENNDITITETASSAPNQNPSSSDELVNKYAERVQMIAEEINKVEKLELKMAIVAPMKAGKSTIINTIIGDDILPSRNAAMTSIPTEIALSSEYAEPVLELSNSAIAFFRKIWTSIRAKINQSSIEEIKNSLSEYTHLIDLVDEVSSHEGFFENEVRGTEKIAQNLLTLNDLVRLHILLVNSPGLMRTAWEIPRVNTPFWHINPRLADKLTGKLILIDTPGPNEAGVGSILEQVVSEQIRKSSIVLIVLDFTGLKNIAAENVKREVQKITELRGKENIYALINKIDQRRNEDLTPEQVVNQVASELGLEEESKASHIFELSARWAFVYSRFAQEQEKYPAKKFVDLQSAQPIVQEMYPVGWEDELNFAAAAGGKEHSEHLKRRAEILWTKSQFEPFLDRAVSALLERVAPLIMRNAMWLSLRFLKELRDESLLREKAIGHNTSLIQNEIEALNRDLEELLKKKESIRKGVSDVQANLFKEIEKKIDVTGKEAKVSLESAFYKLGDNSQEEEVPREKTWYEDALGDVTSLFAPLKRLVSSSTPSELTFNNQKDADEFINSAYQFALDRIDRLMYRVKINTERDVNIARKQLVRLVGNESKPIIQRAQDRLNKTFNIKLSASDFSMDEYGSQQIQPAKTGYATKTRMVKSGTKKVMKRRWFYLFLFKGEVTVELPKKQVNYYVFSLKDLVKQINRAIDQNITNIKSGIKEYLKEDFEDSLNGYFESLDGYLRGYQESLRNAQQDKQLSEDKLKILSDSLNKLVSESEIEKENILTFLKRSEEILPPKIDVLQ